MAERDLDPQYVRRRLRYDPESGKLFWKTRAVVGDVRRMRAWNTMYAGREAFTFQDSSGYRRGSLDGSMLLAHRVAWAIHYGRWPRGTIDHLNGEPCDNCLSNLRDVTMAENAQNSRRQTNSVTGVTGVNLHVQTGRYAARIHKNGRFHHLGLHDSIEAAAIARREAERALGFGPNHGKPPAKDKKYGSR